MTKGKTILTDIVSNSSTYLKPKTIINTTNVTNVTSSLELVHAQLKPKLKPSKVIATVNELELEKTIIKNESATDEIVQKRINIRYTINELKTKFPGYNVLFYTEIFDLLESTDFELSEGNLTSNIQKFIHLGNNIQSQISRLHTNLEVLSVQSFDKIKEKANETIGKLFSSDTKLETAFIEFNIEMTEYRNTLYKEIQNLKDIDLNKMNIINLYFDFFMFIHSELERKNLNDSSGIIQSRVLSLNNSKTVLEQFKNLIQIEIQGKEIQYNNIKNYLDTILPSLYLLRKQDYKEFKVQFKNFIKI